MNEPESQPAPPQIGSYRLLNPLGSGGMGTVYRATHVESGHEVAVKILPRSLAKNPTLLHRFLGEATAAEGLLDPHIVEILDRGVEGGRYYIVMEYLRGGDLHDRVQRLGPLPLSEAVEAVRATSKGLRHAASKGLIHRDIKPANLLRKADGQIKLIDLGLATRTDVEDERITRAGTTVGTVDYMSPEQARDSRAISPRSDIYSLGCTFYYLLAGKPPFGGAELMEKLRRHAQEPAPDIRDERPEIPAPIAELIKRMMAKRPERRFVDYDHLLQALDEADPDRSSTSPMEPESATIVPEDFELPTFGHLKPPDGEIGLVALSDEEMGSGFRDDFRIGPSQAHSSPNLGATQLRPPSRTGSGLTTTSPPEPSDRTRDDPDRSLPAETRDERFGLLEEAAAPAIPPPAPTAPRDRTQLVRLLRGALAGLVLAFLGIVLYRVVGIIVGRIDPPPVANNGGSAADLIHAENPRSADQGTTATAWTEPADPVVDHPEPPAFPADRLEALGLADLATNSPRPAPQPLSVIVQRVETRRDRQHFEEIRRAFDSLNGSIVVADDGPFFEGNFRERDRDRTLRAAPGRRPIVVPRPTATTPPRDALMTLKGTDLTLEGIDLVVDLDVVPAGLETLFQLREGAALTLRDCTITVVGSNGSTTPIALARLGQSSGTNAVRFERCLIRGDAVTAVRIEGGSARVDVVRTAILAGNAPAILIEAAGAGDRSLRLLGSLVESGRSPVELVGPAADSETNPLQVRAYGSVLALGSPAESGPTGLVTLREAPDLQSARVGIDWRGDQNRFLGFDDRSQSEDSSDRSAVGIAGLDDLRQSWPETDLQSGSEPSALPMGTQPGWTTLDDLIAARPELGPLLALTARPTPRLREWSIGRFEPLPVEPEPAGPASTEAGTIVLKIDASNPNKPQDPGVLIRSVRITPEVRRIVVRAKGTGWHPLTPIRLPEGVALDVRVEPPASGKAEDRLVWRPIEGAEGEALIDVRGADLTLVGVDIERDALPAVGFAVQVTQGRLRMADCSITAPGTVEGGGGNLIGFQSEGTRPIGPDPDPDAGGPESWPTCLISDSELRTGGDAIRAELGRGVVALENSAVIAGNGAFVLQPAQVARDRFRADLRLDHCTIAGERDFVRLGPWPGAVEGPDRPWVITSKATAWLDRYDHGGRLTTSVLLRTDLKAVSAGGLIWQSDGDLHDVKHNAVAEGVALGPPRSQDPGERLVGFWGPSHVRSPLDPSKYQLPTDRVPLGSAVAGDLILDPTRPDLPTVGIDPKRFGTWAVSD